MVMKRAILVNQRAYRRRAKRYQSSPGHMWFAVDVLERAAGLPTSTLAAIAELERTVVAADGGRLKLEWQTLRSRNGERVEDLLWWGDGRLLGFLGCYRFAAPAELAGMVAPEARGRGIGAALLDEALPLCAELGDREALLIVPWGSEAGRRVAARRGGALSHSEHALLLSGQVPSGPDEPALRLRTAGTDDLPVLARLLEAGFGNPPPEDLAERLSWPHGPTIVIELDGEPVGTMSLSRDGGRGAVHGFVIDPVLQGRGLGRAALRQACRRLRDEGAEQIGLEVAVENDRALALYTSIGFRPVTTEDYYAMPLPAT
jgi:ribosomal protein S18 acetylase RimI-like enzyme